MQVVDWFQAHMKPTEPATISKKKHKIFNIQHVEYIQQDELVYKMNKILHEKQEHT